MREDAMRTIGIGMLAATAAALGAGAATAAPPPARDAKVWAAAEAARDGQVALLREVVSIDSGTGDAAGGNKVQDIVAARLQAAGLAVTRVPAEAPGLADNLVATIDGTGKARILLIGHIDTVFGPGTVAKWPFRIEGDRATGPGVSDEKGGVVEGITALEILHKLGFRDFKRITFLVESSEERGSPGTRALIGRLIADADVELNLEPGDAPDLLTVWRKGSATYHIDVKGRAAHAGVAPEAGRNAAAELIHQIQADDVFPHSGTGLTANLTLMSAGSRANIIPEDASAQINVRVRDRADFDRVLHTYEANARTTAIPDTKVTVSSEPAYPPLPDNPATLALAARAERIYAGLGLILGRGGNGGASESALAADAGVPALDGLGPVGGGFHSDKEFLELKTVTPRLYMLAKLIMELGPNPPPRMAR
jgi:glutamate carboxypeptidase